MAVDGNVATCTSLEVGHSSLGDDSWTIYLEKIYEISKLPFHVSEQRVLNFSIQTTIQYTGRWSDRCRAVLENPSIKTIYTCSDMPKVNASKLLISYNEGFQLCEVEILTEEIISVNTSNSNLSCEKPNTQPHSSVKITSYNGIKLANYECDIHYKMLGNKTRHCIEEERKWSNEAPACIENIQIKASTVAISAGVASVFIAAISVIGLIIYRRKNKQILDLRMALSEIKENDTAIYEEIDYSQCLHAVRNANNTEASVDEDDYLVPKTFPKPQNASESADYAAIDYNQFLHRGPIKNNSDTGPSTSSEGLPLPPRRKNAIPLDKGNTANQEIVLNPRNLLKQPRNGKSKRNAKTHETERLVKYAEMEGHEDGATANVSPVAQDIHETEDGSLVRNTGHEYLELIN